MSAQIADFNIRFNSESAQFNKDVDYAKKMLRGYTKEAKAANHSTGGFNKQVNVAGVSLKGLGKTAKTTARAFGGVTAGIGAVTTASTYMIRQTAQQAREIERMSTIAQVSAGEIQALGYASEQYNIAGDKMADILKDVNDKIGDFDENEGGEFADFMENIAPLTGLTIEQLQRLSGPEALIAVKEAMDAANLPMKSQLHYLEAIANDASALMPLLENKGAKLYELTQRYDDLNVAMSEYDIEQMKQMDQQLNDMSLKMQASFRQAVIGSKDQIDWLTEHVSYSVSWWGTMFDSMSDNPRTEQGMVKRLGELRGDLKETKAEAEAAKSELKKLEEISGRAEGDAALTARLANAGHPEKLAKTRARFDTLKHDADELQAKIDRAQKAYNIAVLGMNYDKGKPSDTPPGINGGGDGEKPRLSQSEQDELDRKQKAGQARLETLDNQYANERQKLHLAHQQRLSDIDTLQLSEQEITRQGYDSLEALRAAYVARENAYYDGEKNKYQQRREAEINQTLTEWQQRLALQAAGEEAAATQESLAYVNRQTRLEEQFTVAMEKAAGNQALEQELEAQYFANREALWDQHQGNLTKIEQDAAKARRMKQVVELRNYSDLFGNMAGVAEAFSGKQSGLYRGMFAASKAFAVAESIVKIQQGIASASALPFPSNIPAMATVMSSTAGIVNTIQSTQMAGMAHSGISEVPREGTWLLDKGERVYTNDSARQIDQMYQAVMAMNRQRFSANDPAVAYSQKMAANGNQATAQPWLIEINEAPPGTTADIDDEKKVVSIMMKDAQRGGPYMNYISQKLGVKPGGYK